jgi:hypothetical protein
MATARTVGSCQLDILVWKIRVYLALPLSAPAFSVLGRSSESGVLRFRANTPMWEDGISIERSPDTVDGRYNQSDFPRPDTSGSDAIGGMAVVSPGSGTL